MNIDELLVLTHNFIDNLNCQYGNIKELCLYCHSKETDSSGIVHKKDCILKQMRIILDGKV